MRNLVGATGLEPVKAVKPGDLQSPAIAAMRYSQKIDYKDGLEPSANALSHFYGVIFHHSEHCSKPTELLVV